MSIFKKMQGNWCDFAYPTAIIFLCWFAFEITKRGNIRIYVGSVLSFLLVLGAFSIPFLQSADISIPYNWNPFRHNVGWTNLSLALLDAGYDPKTEFLFGDKYQISSILSFYGEDQKRAYFLNLHGIRKNQFSFWPGMEKEQKGKTGYFVITENSPQLEKQQEHLVKYYTDKLKEYFSEVHYLGMKPLFESNHKVLKGALIFKCIDYNGKVPPETDLY